MDLATRWISLTREEGMLEGAHPQTLWAIPASATVTQPAPVTSEPPADETEPDQAVEETLSADPDEA
jgi:hypothetical protein